MAGFALPYIPSVTDMRSSVFCLTITGHGWGMRLTTALLLGCIPVIIEDNVIQPYEDVLPYPEFSVRVRTQDLEKLPQILKDISPEQVLPLFLFLLPSVFPLCLCVRPAALDSRTICCRPSILMLFVCHPYYPPRSRPSSPAWRNTLRRLCGTTTAWAGAKRRDSSRRLLGSRTTTRSRASACARTRRACSRRWTAACCSRRGRALRLIEPRPRAAEPCRSGSLG